MRNPLDRHCAVAQDQSPLGIQIFVETKERRSKRNVFLMETESFARSGTVTIATKAA